MWKHEAEEFCDYEVFEIVDGKVHILCACKEYKVAEVIAVTLAKADPSHDHYFVTGINHPGDFIVGGGWHDEYWIDENGKLRKSSLS